VPETLMHALHQLTEQYESARKDPEFERQLHYYLEHYVGRPSPLYFAERLTQAAGGARIYLKREDLNHTGAHKINNCIGQALLTKRMGKPRVIAETGAGMHGVATGGSSLNGPTAASIWRASRAFALMSSPQATTSPAFRLAIALSRTSSNPRSTTPEGLDSSVAASICGGSAGVCFFAGFLLAAMRFWSTRESGCLKICCRLSRTGPPSACPDIGKAP
jgi:hypothetical protein